MQALDEFFAKWKSDPLVVLKWLGLQVRRKIGGRGWEDGSGRGRICSTKWDKGVVRQREREVQGAAFLMVVYNWLGLQVGWTKGRGG